MTKFYSAPELEIRKYAISQEQIFTSGPGEGDDFELDSIDPSSGAKADAFFADEDN
jgi:hypothetical protein